MRWISKSEVWSSNPGDCKKNISKKSGGGARFRDRVRGSIGLGIGIGGSIGLGIGIGGSIGLGIGIGLGVVVSMLLFFRNTPPPKKKSGKLPS